MVATLGGLRLQNTQWDLGLNVGIIINLQYLHGMEEWHPIYLFDRAFLQELKKYKW